MSKTFKSIIVISAATGIGVMREGDSLTFSDVQEFYSHFLGFPIWTHEMGTGPIMSLAELLLREKFTEMPTYEFCSESPRTAAQVMVDIYGETMIVEKGSMERPEDPISTLKAMVGDKDITLFGRSEGKN